MLSASSIIALLVAAAVSFWLGRLHVNRLSVPLSSVVENILIRRKIASQRIAQKFTLRYSYENITETCNDIERKDQMCTGYSNPKQDEVLTSEHRLMERHYEMLTHPSILVHEYARNVAIIAQGNPQDAIHLAKQVLKHQYLQSILLFADSMTHTCPTDGTVQSSYQDVCEESCHNHQQQHANRSTSFCTWDIHAKVVIRNIDDTMPWFVDHYAVKGSGKQRNFDVIIVDTMDLKSPLMLDDRYISGMFQSALSNALTDNGIVVFSGGATGYKAAPWSPIPTESRTRRVSLIDTLVSLDYEVVRDYEQFHYFHDTVWTYVIAFKNFETKANWFDNSALVNYYIRESFGLTLPETNYEQVHPPAKLLQYFDSATIRSLQHQSKASEKVHCVAANATAHKTNARCRRDQGHQYDPNIPMIPASSLEVKRSGAAERAGRGVYSKVDIPRDSYIALDRFVHFVYIPPQSYTLIRDLEDHPLFWKRLEGVTSYIHDYGLEFRYRGKPEYMVDANLLTFRNHGCNGTYNIGLNSDITEQNAATDFMPLELQGRLNGKQYVYNPISERNSFFTHCIRPLRSIAKGEEILGNYLTFDGGDEHWRSTLESLRTLCAGAPGPIEIYQNEKKRKR